MNKFIVFHTVSLFLFFQFTFADSFTKKDNLVDNYSENIHRSTTVTNEPDKSRILDFFKGNAPNNAVYLGMLTWHFDPSSREEDRLTNNLVGILYNSIFVGTFLNSFSDRAFSIGIQRNLLSHYFPSNIEAHVGYRLGIVSGYDDRMSDFSKYLPALPFSEIYINFSYRRLGFELSYVAVVLTAKFYITF